MAQQARTVIEALVDFFFYAEYVKSDKADRVLICEGDETIWAGARSAGGRQFPALLPMVAEDTYGVISDAFKGEFAGLNPAEIFPSKATSNTARDFLKKQATKAKRPNKGGALRNPAKRKAAKKRT